MNELIIDKKNIVDIAYQDNLLSDYTLSIKRLIDDVSKNYIFVGFWLSKAKKLDLKSLGYENIEDYGFKVFGLSKPSVYNMIGIAEKFCRWDGFYANYPTLKDEFKGFNYTQLRELLTLEEVDVNRFKNKTVVQIQEIKIIDKIKDYIKLDIENDLETLNEKVVKSLNCISKLIDTFKTKEDPVLKEDLVPYIGKEKCKEDKISYNISNNRLDVIKNYQYQYKNDAMLKFELTYCLGYYKEKIEKQIFIRFILNDWDLRRYVNDKDKSDIVINLTDKDTVNNNKLLDGFTTYFKAYFKAVKKDKKENDESDKNIIDKNLKVINQMGDVSINDISKEIAYKKLLKSKFENLNSFIDINDKETLFFITGYYFSFNIYFKIDDTYYYQIDAWNGRFTLYEKHINNENNIRFYVVSNPLTKSINNLILDYYKNNINLLKGENKK